MDKAVHNISPVYDKDSHILILGSFPSVKSRESKFFYGHPQNRFWKMLARIFESNEPQTIEDKKHLLLSNHIAVWDVIASCEINGSSDSSIKNVVPNDLSLILKEANIQRIILNGGKAYDLFMKYTCSNLPSSASNMEIIKMPSTSPANAAWSLERLVNEWGKSLKE